MYGGKSAEGSRHQVYTFIIGMCDVISRVCRDIPGSILGQLIDYCYTSAVEVTAENVQALLAAAGQLQLSWVQEVACDFLHHHLEPSNCLAIASLADMHACPLLHMAALTVAQHSFTEVGLCVCSNILTTISLVGSRES